MKNFVIYYFARRIFLRQGSPPYEENKNKKNVVQI